MNERAKRRVSAAAPTGGARTAVAARAAQPTADPAWLPPCTLYRLRMAARRATRFYDQALAPSGLGIAQFGVMNAIRVHAGGTVTDIARRLDMDRTTLTRNLRPLVRAGLVTIAAGRDDRARSLVLTDAGAARLNEAVPYWRAAQARVAATLGAAETHALNSLLALALDRLPDV